MKTVCRRSLVLCMLSFCLASCAGQKTPVAPQQQGAAQTTVTQQVTDAPGFSFSRGKALLYPGLDVTVFPDTGDVQTGYFEAESCAALGLDKTYVFSDYEVTTFPDGDKDLIASIIFKTDAVSTMEGADLSMSADDIRALYGAPDTETSRALTYVKGDMRLMFFFDEDGFLTSVEYRFGVAE